MQGKMVNQYLNQKAGMSEVDVQNIAKHVERLTAGSPKALHEQDMQQKRSLEVAQMLKKCLQFSAEQRQDIKLEWWAEMNLIRQNRVLDRVWAHFDFDMFYVACQLLERPELKDKPCAVGGRNSVLCTANYEARKHGLRSAMPAFIALELCPQVVLFEPNFTKYKKYSKIFREILSHYDPQVQSHGLDEAYVDLTSHLTGSNFQETQKFIAAIRQEIFQKTGLTVSCGVGSNKMLAKMASEERKPNDQFLLQNNGKIIETYMSNKRIRKIPGVGPVNQFYLKGLGIETGKDLLDNVDVLIICFSRQACQFFVRAALGVGSIQHQFSERKSVGKSETFKVTQDINFLQSRLKALCEEVSMELQQLGFLSLNTILTYQTSNFERRDKTFNLDCYTDKQEPLFGSVVAFMKSLKSPIRLLGVKCNNIIKTEELRKQQLFTYMGNCKKKREQSGEVEASAADQVKSLMQSEVVEKGKYLCPICNQAVICKGNISLFNRHVDKCLTSGDNVVPQQSMPEQVEGGHNKSVRIKANKGKVSKKGDGKLTQFLKKQ